MIMIIILRILSIPRGHNRDYVLLSMLRNNTLYNIAIIALFSINFERLNCGQEATLKVNSGGSDK